MILCRPCIHIVFTVGVLITGISGSKDALVPANRKIQKSGMPQAPKSPDYLSGTAEGIGCFVCTSINHNNPECEDTFNNTGKFFVTDCWGSRKGRVGLFPGTQCIKMVAEDEDTGYSILIRNCVVDNGSTNPESEIGRTSHCGWMRVLRYMGKKMRGCIVSCDTDACNGAVKSYQTSSSLLLLATVLAWVRCS